MSRKQNINEILVLGAGELGSAVLQELARVREQAHLSSVSVLRRPAREGAGGPSEKTMAIGSLDIDVVEADLATAAVDELATLFSRFGQVICCTGFVGGAGTQRKITEAVLRAGVEHYIPWQFGVNYDEVGRGSGQEAWDEQIDVREMLRAQNETRWTIVSTGMFTSFVFIPAFGIVDLAQNTVHALGNWDHRLTVTTPQDIGRVTAMIATSHQRPESEIVFVAGDTFSYRELADTVDRVLGGKVERILWSLPELRADAAAHPDDIMRKYRLAFARPNGVAWPKDRTFNAAQGMMMVDVATWLRDLRGVRLGRDGIPPR